MPRYEISDGSTQKFWEAELAGAALTLKWGKVGGGSTSMSTREFGDAAAAKKELDKLVAEKVKKGFALVGGKAKTKAAKAEPVKASAKTAPAKAAAKPEPVKAAKPAKAASNADLEKAIIANPDDADAYLVYADWLQSQGNPHGELIVLQHQAASNKALNKKAAALLEKLKGDLLGEFATRPPAPASERERYGRGGAAFDLEWYCGFIKKATFGWDPFDDEEMSEEEKEADDHYEARFLRFLMTPAARFVQELELGPIPGSDYMSLSAFATAIEAAPPPCLRVLDLGDTSPWDISSTSTSMPASKAIRGLHTLKLRGGDVSIGKIDLPELLSFTVESGGLGSDAVKQIAKANWPKLERLEVWFGDPNYGGGSDIGDIKPILAAKGLPKLKHLLLKNCAFADAIAMALPKSAILPQLETLDLSMGNLSDRGVQAMAAAKASFAHLAELNVEDNALTDASKPLLKGLAKKVNFGSGPRNHDPDRAVPRPKGEDSRYNRYTSVNE